MFRATVRFGRLRHLAELLPEEPGPAPGPRTPCVIRTERGDELGSVLVVSPFQGGAASAGARRAYLRAATAGDLERARAQDEQVAIPARAFAQERAAKHGLGLRVVAAEPVLSGDRLLVYYVAEDRLDLRELARDVRARFAMPVELRQIGARERARASCGAGVCGRTLCCSSFLRELEPVTLRMAKVQGFSLSPDATQGACGRLKCCLRYENPLYEEGRGALPRIGSHVEAARASGEVVSLSVLTRQVTVRTRDGWLVDLYAAEIAAARTVVAPTPDEAAAPPPGPEPPRDSRWRGITDRLRLFRRRRSDSIAPEGEEPT